MSVSQHDDLHETILAGRPLGLSRRPASPGLVYRSGPPGESQDRGRLPLGLRGFLSTILSGLVDVAGVDVVDGRHD
jgi:hypothetical protein